MKYILPSQCSLISSSLLLLSPIVLCILLFHIWIPCLLQQSAVRQLRKTMCRLVLFRRFVFFFFRRKKYLFLFCILSAYVRFKEINVNRNQTRYSFLLCCYSIDFFLSSWYWCSTPFLRSHFICSYVLWCDSLPLRHLFFCSFVIWLVLVPDISIDLCIWNWNTIQRTATEQFKQLRHCCTSRN